MRVILYYDHYIKICGAQCNVIMYDSVEVIVTYCRYLRELSQTNTVRDLFRTLIN